MEDHEDILARYKRMRAATRGMNNALLDLCKPSVKQAAEGLGVLVNDTVVMDVDRMPVLMDHAIYHGGQGGRNAVERYAAEHPPRSRFRRPGRAARDAGGVLLALPGARRS
jgi:hypothetical protein